MCVDIQPCLSILWLLTPFAYTELSLWSIFLLRGALGIGMPLTPRPSLLAKSQGFQGPSTPQSGNCCHHCSRY